MVDALLGGKTDAASKLVSFRVDVRLAAGSTGNALDACLVALNLLQRFLKRVRYKGDKKALAPLGGMRPKKISSGSEGDASMTLVFGDEPVSTSGPTLYVGSSGWSAYLSEARPCGWNPPVRNKLGALYAGALAVGEVFKAVFPEAMPEKIRHLEHDLVTHGRARQPVIRPDIPRVLDLSDFAIVGCGAVGQALGLALKNTARLSGNITLFDPDAIDQSNEQRYPLGLGNVSGINKAQYLAAFLQQDNPLLVPGIVPHKYEDYMGGYPCMWSDVAVCVDNVWTRINVQGAVPRTVWNGWTDVSPNSLRYGVSRHVLGNDNACIACYYYPDGPSPSESDMNSIRTGLPREEVERLAAGATCTPELVERVSKNTGIPFQVLKGAVGKPFHALLHGNCGVFNQRVHGAGVTAPAPHQPMLVGIMLAAQLVLAQADPSAVPVESLSEFDALKIPSHLCVFRSEKHPRCFCNEPAYKKAYRDKWGA